MPQSLSQVIVHIVFSTKDRQKWLGAAISPRMHAYLATVCRDHDCEAYRVGGVCRPCPPCSSFGPYYQPGRPDRDDQNQLFCLDQEARECPSLILLATRLWGVLGG